MKITVKAVAKKMGISEQTLRLIMQQGICPFGAAVKLPESSSFDYIFYPAKLREYVGEVDGMDEERSSEQAMRLLAQKVDEFYKSNVVLQQFRHETQDDVEQIKKLATVNLPKEPLINAPKLKKNEIFIPSAHYFAG